MWSTPDARSVAARATATPFLYHVLEQGPPSQAIEVDGASGSAITVKFAARDFWPAPFVSVTCSRPGEPAARSLNRYVVWYGAVATGPPPVQAGSKTGKSTWSTPAGSEALAVTVK